MLGVGWLAIQAVLRWGCPLLLLASLPPLPLRPPQIGDARFSYAGGQGHSDSTRQTEWSIKRWKLTLLRLFGYFFSGVSVTRGAISQCSWSEGIKGH